MTSEEQIDQWVKGNSVHIGEGSDQQCCPDFSCCFADLRAPLDVRQKFKAGDSRTRYGMLMHFLGAVLARELPNHKVYVVGQGTPQ
jgi:hypothetical protein